MKCCIENCVNNGKVKKNQSSASSTERITYHLFPSHAKQRETWLKSLGIPNLVPTNRTVICSNHFKKEDFYFTQNETRRIKSGVVPFIKCFKTRETPKQVLCIVLKRQTQFFSFIMKENERKCLKCGCSPAQDANITLHRFPKPGRTNSLRCELWAKYCFPHDSWSSPEFQQRLHSRHLMLCTRHFKRSSFFDDAGKRLVKSAAPDEECDKITLADPNCITLADPDSITLADPNSITLADPDSITLADPDSITLADPDSDDCNESAASRVCKICLSLDVKMYQIKEHGLDKMYQDIIGIPPRIDAQKKLPMGICWECTARLQSASAFRSKALFSDALLDDHLKNNDNLNIIDIQNIHEHETNLKSSLKIQEVFKFNSHNVEEHAPNTFIKTEVLGIPNNEEMEVEVQDLVTDTITIKDEGKNEVVIDNFPNTDFKTEVDLIPNTQIELGEETSFDDDISDNDNGETVIENVYVNESRQSFEKVLKNEKEKASIDFAANLSEIMQTNDDELMNLAKNLTSEDEDDDDEKSNASDDGGIKINLLNKTVRCVKVKPNERKTKKAKIGDDGLIIWVKGRPKKKKQPYVKPCMPIDENIFSVKTLSHEDLRLEIQARRDSDKYKNAPYKCDVCFRGFPTKDKKDRHVIKHSEQSGPIKCNICHVRMKKTRDLRAHMKRQHTMEFICKLCPMVTRIRNVALGHMKYHAGNKYECPQCFVEFEKQTTLLNHLRLKHMSAYVCELCGYTFVSKNGVDVHKRMKHKLFDTNTVFKGPHCDVCDVKFLTEKAYSRHLRLSSKHITEDDPNRMSNDPSIKQRRLSSTWHSVRRPVIHRKNESTPANNGPVTCEQCGVVLESLRVYASHFKYAHPGVNRTQFTYASTPYMCEHCGKFFLNTTTLSCHMWVHTGQKLFQCDHCNKAFSMKANLAGHMRQHEGIRRTYDCRVCGKHFTFSYNLTRHMFLHTGLRPFKCDACEKTFRTSGELRAHVDHVHLKKPRPKRVRRKANKCELTTLEY